jgi:hypothetical protein
VKTPRIVEFVVCAILRDGAVFAPTENAIQSALEVGSEGAPEDLNLQSVESFAVKPSAAPADPATACPFCGDSDPQHDEVSPGVHVLVCQGCGAIGPHDLAVPQDAAAGAAAWGKRHARPDLLDLLSRCESFLSGFDDCHGEDRPSMLDDVRAAIEGHTATSYYHLDDAEHATVLAALRYWQREGLMSSGHEGDIATQGGTMSMMQPNEIDELCERLNTGG